MLQQNMNTNTKRLVLVVEDDELNRSILRELLSGEFEVLEAANGEEGLAELEKHYEELALILLDVYMPVCDGFEFLRRKSAEQRYNSVPVIVATSSESLDDELECLQLGANDFIIKPYNGQIILNRANNLIRLRESAAIVNDLTWDTITGLYNKEFFYNKAEGLIAADEGAEYDLLCSDIENYRMLNDRYGEVRCNELLAELAASLSRVLGQPLAGRIGSDTLAFLLPHAKRNHEELLAPVVDNLVVPHAAVKFGVIEQLDTSLSINANCTRALSAADTIKGRHDTFVAPFDEELHRRQELERTLIEDMERALEQRQFELYYQPKHSVYADTIGGAEALIRWIHPTIGFISPGVFIPLFERNGFITKLDLYVWEEACKELARLKELGLPVVPISANVSRLDFDMPNLPQVFAEIADRYGIEHELLHVEITETAYTDDPELVISTLATFRELGFSTELDDFGSGYSSLVSLNMLPLNIMKLDMSMIRSATELDDFRIVESTIKLAQTLALKTVVEGVETKEEAAHVAAYGCDYIQGYYYSKPLDRAGFEAYLVKDLD